MCAARANLHDYQSCPELVDQKQMTYPVNHPTASFQIRGIFTIMSNPTLHQLMTARNALGVDCQASKTDIQRAFRAKVKTLHPDHCMHLSLKQRNAAVDRLATVIQSYRLLRNYDSPAQKDRLRYHLSYQNKRKNPCAIALRTVALLLIACLTGRADDVKLSWTANTEPDLAGYKLYSGTTSGVYGPSISVGNVTAYTVSGLGVGTYFFRLKAVDTSGNESGFSNEVSKIIAVVTPPPQGLIISNITPTNYVTAALSVGNSFYVDAAYTLTTIPSLLAGQTWIKTRHGDRFNSSTGVSFTVNQPVTVYVGSQAATLPAWLQSGWTNTGVQITSSVGGFKVYSKAFPAGLVSLGPNLNSAAYMYTITVVPAVQTPLPVPGPAITLTGPAGRQLTVTRLPDNASTQLPLTVNLDDCVKWNGVTLAGGKNCP